METFRPSGSFKDRGVGLKCEKLAAGGAKKFISSSGGNAGLAVAFCGRKLGIPVTVIVPTTTKPLMLDRIKLQEAEVIVSGENWNASDKVAREIVQSDPTNAYIHPFDDPLLWEGHSSLIDEVMEQGLKPQAVITVVGGGGLLCGIMSGLTKHGLVEETAVITAETEGAASFASSVQKKELVTLDGIHSIATSLGARRVCEAAYQWSTKHNIQAEVVSDKDTVEACTRFAHDHMTLVEPACGAALSLIYNKNSILKDFEDILVVVCGGSGVDLEIMSEWKKQFHVK